jgi:heme/copper-type cytochrome/quinol oxidase subunit 1
MTYGWFAYAPLSETTYVPYPGMAPGATALLAGLGALLVGGAAGFVVGRRSLPAAPAATGEDDTPAG